MKPKNITMKGVPLVPNDNNGMIAVGRRNERIQILDLCSAHASLLYATGIPLWFGWSVME